MRRARDQLLTFASFPGRVAATNNACERDLRPAVIQRKNTNGYRAMWSAKGEAAVRTVVATVRLKTGASPFDTVLRTINARPPSLAFTLPGNYDVTGDYYSKSVAGIMEFGLKLTQVVWR